MTDPFDVLRLPTEPVAPDPAFATALRARIERALLDLTEEPSMTATIGANPRQATPVRATPVRATPVRATPVQADPSTVRLHALTPYLAAIDAEAAARFYSAAFGARPRGEPIVMPDGRIGHVEMLLGDSVLMLADEFPEMGLRAPGNLAGVSQSLLLQVPDPDATVAAALAAGARLERPVTDSSYGRTGVVIDPSGHRWMVSREVSTVRPGGLVSASLRRPDVPRAERFYADVIGRSITVEMTGEMTGEISGATTQLCFAVPDVDAAVGVVRAAGGAAEEPYTTSRGRVADCVDDQGLLFALTTGDARPADPDTLPYVELRVPDPTAARAFYGTVLGWRFFPGADVGYWHVADADTPHQPWLGLTRGSPTTVVPTFTVPDLSAAAAAVAAAGGRVVEPAPGRHGRTVEAVDNQGAPIILSER